MQPHPYDLGSNPTKKGLSKNVDELSKKVANIYTLNQNLIGVLKEFMTKTTTSVQSLRDSRTTLLFNLQTLINYLIDKNIFNKDEWQTYVDNSSESFIAEIEKNSDIALNLEKVSRGIKMGDVVSLKVRGKDLAGTEIYDCCSDNYTGIMGNSSIKSDILPLPEEFWTALLDKTVGEKIDGFRTKVKNLPYQDELLFDFEILAVKQFKAISQDNNVVK